MTILYFIIMMGIIVSIHEFGHMIVAKIFNVYVKEYAIGFGPTVFKKKGKETLYSLRLLPLGGFTAMIEQPAEEDEELSEEDRIIVEEERTFYGAKWYKRIAILFAGPLFNLLLAILVFVLLFQITGYTTVYGPPVIDGIVNNSPASKAGLMDGDYVNRIVYEDGGSIVPETFEDIISNNQLHNYCPLDFYVTRNGENIVIHIVPEYMEEYQGMMVGITTNIQKKELNFFSAIPEGVKYTFKNIALTVESIIMMFKGNLDKESIGGTIAIYNYTKEAVSYGFISYLSLIGSLSLSVGLMNLIPIPVVDGGRILLTFFEELFGKKFTEKFEKYLLAFGWLLIIGIFIAVTVLDISKMMK